MNEDTEMEIQLPTCGQRGRKRTMLDAYDYNPLQVVTGQLLGWYSHDDGELCAACMARLMDGDA